MGIGCYEADVVVGALLDGEGTVFVVDPEDLVACIAVEVCDEAVRQDDVGGTVWADRDVDNAWNRSVVEGCADEAGELINEVDALCC